MALDANRVAKVAAAFQNLSQQTISLLALIGEELNYNTSQAIVWGTVDGTIVTVDARGNLTGFDFSPASVSKCINSFLQLQKLLTNLVPTQGDHQGNMNLLGNP